MAIVVGLTGNMASGKSTVATILKELGAYIIDADAIGHQIIGKGQPAWHDIVEEFGKEVLLADGSVNRKRLGEIVFSDREKLKRLNAITHPRIREEIERRIELIKKSSPRAIIVVDAALLIEVGSHRKVDVVVVVTARKEQLIKRAMEKFSLTEGEAEKRLGAQMPQEEKLKYADFVIDNSGSLEKTAEAVRGLYEELKRMEAEGFQTKRG